MPSAGLPGVFHCGWHSERSFGAASYLLQRPSGNIMVDSPRWELGALGLWSLERNPLHPMLSPMGGPGSGSRVLGSLGSRAVGLRESCTLT